MSNCPPFISKHAGVDLYQDLEYILKDVTNEVDFQVIKKSAEEKEAIVKLCLTTISQIYQSYNETHIRTFIYNILDKYAESQKPQKLKIKIATKTSAQKSYIETNDSQLDKSNNEHSPLNIKKSNPPLIVEQSVDIPITSPQLSPNSIKTEQLPVANQSETPTIVVQLDVIHNVDQPKVFPTSNQSKVSPPTNKSKLIKKITSPVAIKRKLVPIPLSQEIEIKANLEKIEKFKKLPNYKQKSQEWLDQRNNYLTASTIAAAMGMMGPVARRNLLINKVSNGKVNGFTGNSATHWGNKYEPVANRIYSHRNNNVIIYEFGMITNEKYPILGISPDGVTQYRMLEIKCPFSRVIDGKVKVEYYHQMQEQLAICEFNECDFLECRFEEITENRFWDDFDYYNPKDNKNREKGLIISYLNLDDVNSNDFSVEYMYSPIEYYQDLNQMRKWHEKTLDEFRKSSNKVYLGESYWQLNAYSCQIVKRDPQWVVDNYPILQAFWDEVEYYRKLGIDKLMEKIKNDSEITEKIDTADEFDEDIRNIAKFYEKKETKEQKKINNDKKIKSTNKKVKNLSGHCLLD